MRIGLLSTVRIACLAVGVFSICAAVAQTTPPGAEIVTVPSGSLHLKALLWKPAGNGPFPAVLFSHGSGGATASETAGMPMTETAARLGPLFARHGYVFLYLFRRGQGLSADQGPFLRDLLKKEEAAHGSDASWQLSFHMMTTDHLDDTLAGIAALKSLPGVDPHRIALVGHSFGAQLTLLAAQREPSVRAVVSFAAAAVSWEHSEDLRRRLLEAVDHIRAPIMLIHAANDFSIAPGRALSDELERRHKPHVLKIYPPSGTSHDDGHNFVYRDVPTWEKDVFQFLDLNLTRWHDMDGIRN